MWKNKTIPGWRAGIRMLPAMPLEVVFLGGCPTVSLQRNGGESTFSFSYPCRGDVMDQFLHRRDVYSIRQQFFRAKTESDVFNFLNKYGPFLSSDDERVDGARYGRLTLTDFRNWQKLLTLIAMQGFLHYSKIENDESENCQEYGPTFYKVGVYGPSLADDLKPLFFSCPKQTQDWLRGEASLLHIFRPKPDLEIKNPPTKTEVTVMAVIDAILATIYFDKIIGIPWALCTLEGCNQLYQITSKHERNYCSPACARNASIRARRAKEKVNRVKEKEQTQTTQAIKGEIA
jgi:hypothetical protein